MFYLSYAVFITLNILPEYAKNVKLGEGYHTKQEGAFVNLSILGTCWGEAMPFCSYKVTEFPESSHLAAFVALNVMAPDVQATVTHGL